MKWFQKKQVQSVVRKALIYGDIYTKFSFIVMGLSNIVRKQIIKGFIFLGIELGFIWYMIEFGVIAISHGDDLGHIRQGMVLDEEKGIYVKAQGDNSMLLLLGAVVTIFIVILFIYLWRASIKSGLDAEICKKRGQKICSFKEDMKKYLDKDLNKTMLCIPVLGVLVFQVMPLVFMILIAFTNFDREHQPPGNLFHWIGLGNFKVMLSMGSSIGNTFWPVLGWTITWAIFSTFLNFLGGMLLATIINRKGTRCKKLWRMIFVLSIAIPQFVSLLVMRSLLSEKGAINILLQDMGLIKGAIPFFTRPIWAKISVVVVNLWVGVPYSMLITSGILQNIPEDLYESAKIDGANPWVEFSRITLPYMLFVTTPYLITQFVGNMNNFNVIYFLTGGLPQTNTFYQAGKTDLLVTWLYKLTVDSFDYSYAAVIGILVFIISATLSLVVYRKTGSYKNEEGFQ